VTAAPPKKKRRRPRARVVLPSKLSARARTIIARTKANRTRLYVEDLGSTEPPHIVPYPLEKHPVLPVDPADADD
jgi:hypothetical protein